MTQAILATILTPILAKMVARSVLVKKVLVRLIQFSGGKLKIPNGFSLGATPRTTTMTAIKIAEEKEGTYYYYMLLIKVYNI